MSDTLTNPNWQIAVQAIEEEEDIAPALLKLLRRCFGLIICNANTNAAQRKGKAKVFNLTIENLICIWRRQCGKCYYYRDKLMDLTAMSSWHISIERKRQNEGYTPENTVLCCEEFNGRIQWSHKKGREFLRSHDLCNVATPSLPDQSANNNNKTFTVQEIRYIRNVISVTKRKSIKCNRAFDFSLQEIIDMLHLQNRRCTYSGILMQLNQYSSWRMSISRRDPRLGFIKGNVFLIIAELNNSCNRGKKTHISIPRKMDTQWTTDKVDEYIDYLRRTSSTADEIEELIEEDNVSAESKEDQIDDEARTGAIILQHVSNPAQTEEQTGPRKRVRVREQERNKRLCAREVLQVPGTGLSGLTDNDVILVRLVKGLFPRSTLDQLAEILPVKVSIVMISDIINRVDDFSSLLSSIDQSETEKSNCAKLTDNEVLRLRVIKRLFPQLTQDQLMRMMPVKVSTATISNTLNRKLRMNVSVEKENELILKLKMEERKNNSLLLLSSSPIIGDENSERKEDITNPGLPIVPKECKHTIIATEFPAASGNSPLNRKGTANPAGAKLTDDDVLRIRVIKRLFPKLKQTVVLGMLSRSEAPFKRAVNVSATMVYKILKREKWTHLTVAQEDEMVVALRSQNTAKDTQTLVDVIVQDAHQESPTASSAISQGSVSDHNISQLVLVREDDI